MKSSVSSPHRSRPEENNCVSAIFRSSRGKSAQATHLSFDPSKQPLFSTLDRSSLRACRKNHSNTLCTHRDRGDRSSHSSPSTPLNTRYASEPKEVPRKYLSLTPVMKKQSASVVRPTHFATQNDNDDDNFLDPWVRRLEHSPSADRPRMRATSEKRCQSNEHGFRKGEIQGPAGLLLNRSYFSSFGWFSGNEQIWLFGCRSSWPRYLFLYSVAIKKEACHAWILCIMFRTRQ